jgi:putative membrane protein
MHRHLIAALAAPTLAVLALSVAPAALAAGAAPTDPQIAHIAYTAGVVDIEAARQAVEKAGNKEVAAFARDMIRDHEAVNKQALDLVKKLNVTPQDNDTSRQLAANAEKERQKLAGLKGAAFDKAYIDNEVAYHKTVNAALKTALIPAAQNPDLKALLETGLKLFEGHQQHAEHVAATLK